MPNRSGSLVNRLLDRARGHVGPDVPLDRARSRTSAYIYGNILVLAAVVAADPAGILRWSALAAIAGAMITTFLAHMLAHAIGQQLGRTAEEAQLHVRDEFRDSWPIASSASIPAVMMTLGALRVAPPVWAEVIAAAIIIGRLAFMGILVERMTGRASTLGMLWSGVVLAALSTVVVAIKIVTTF